LEDDVTRYPNDRELERWLALERAGRDSEAEAALGELLERLPELGPSVGFADRVMLAIAAPPALPAAVRPAAGRSWLLRGLLAACLTLVALTTPLLPALLAPVSGRISVGGMIQGAADAVAALARWMAGAAAVWEGLARISGWAAAVAGAPQAVAALLLMVAVAALALRRLSDLIAHERSWSHVRT
jgi:hypothetical protein